MRGACRSGSPEGIDELFRTCACTDECVSAVRAGGGAALPSQMPPRGVTEPSFSTARVLLSSAVLADVACLITRAPASCGRTELSPPATFIRHSGAPRQWLLLLDTSTMCSRKDWLHTRLFRFAYLLLSLPASKTGAPNSCTVPQYSGLCTRLSSSREAETGKKRKKRKSLICLIPCLPCKPDLCDIYRAFTFIFTGACFLPAMP